MSISVFISPYANDGILRVIEAQREHLPKFGVELAPNPNEADVICNHGTALVEAPGVPSVSVGHGMYWSRQPWGDDFMTVNAQVVDTMRHAVAHTAPSIWVSNAIRRGGFWYPEVVYHGIDGDKFLPSRTHKNYILWNKARADYVSDPKDLMAIAYAMPHREFHTTIGSSGGNVKVIGAMPFQKMKQVVAEAGVYLATVRETFGIGTLEAMAYGIPIAGWDWGGQSEIIQSGITGYLASPGDYKALAQCIEACFSERGRLAANCIEVARSVWRWEHRIEQYANIFKRVHKKYNLRTGPKVSILVTAYKLDRFLPECLDSIVGQTYKNFECVVIDDANLASTREIVRKYAERDDRFRYIATPQNLGLPGARNFGFENSIGQYIRHVDADDFLAPNALELEATALDSRPATDIVYGHIEVVREDGTRVMEGGEPVRSGWPKESFDWYEQMAHMNQLPSCVMARRSVFERSGGYRERMWRNEDAEFWCRVTSLGLRAEKVTQAVTYFHRERHDSKGANEWATDGQEPDWTAWFPWRMGGTDVKSGMSALRKHANEPPNTHLVPFGAQGTPPRGLKFWYVHDYTYPIVSIIVTCGPGHKKYLIDALDSIQAQTYPDWECVVVNDTGEPWEPDIMGAPWAHVVNMDGNLGTSAARNAGFPHTRGRYIIWMDADDYWLPWYLEKTVNYAENNFGVIYSDIILNDDSKTFKIYPYPEFRAWCEQLASHMLYAGSSVLYPRDIVEKMIEKQGGYDLNAPGMEDWDYQVAVHDLGFCAYHIPEPLWVYRRYTSTKREQDFGRIEEIQRFMDNKWSAYRRGEKKIMCGCNQPKTPASATPASILKSSGNFSDASIAQLIESGDKQQMVMVEYIGPVQETFSISSRLNRSIRYRFGNNETHRSRATFLSDALYLIGLNGREGQPLYRIISNTTAPSGNDPAAFIGQPITA